MQEPQHKASLENNLYELGTDVGPVTIQMISLPSYVWIIVTHSRKLNMDGSLQLAIQTPYVLDSLTQEEKPTVINLGVDEHQASSNDLCRKVSADLGCAVVLSMNMEG